MGRVITRNPQGQSPDGVFANVDVTTSITIDVNRIYWVDTSGGAVTLTLPAAAVMGDIIKIIDATGNFGTNNLTVNPNSGKIMRQADTMTVSTEGASFTLLYHNSTNGWLVDGI